MVAKGWMGLMTTPVPSYRCSLLYRYRTVVSSYGSAANMMNNFSWQIRPAPPLGLTIHGNQQLSRNSE